ncbi:MAG: stage II sporulation protein R [Pelosinus sp.]|nr:stage II sporulation protein R [Pelosinus sp.]
MRRKFICIVSMITIFAVVSLGWGLFFRSTASSAVTAGPDGLIRLHVLANSDSKEDQALKLKVRDAIIAYLEPLLSNAEDAAAARRIVGEQRENLILAARQVILANGADYKVRIQLGTFDFPIKTYGELVLPAGKYEAVRVLIGQGEGSNWWCVLFPPLCFIDITNAAATQNNQDKEREVEFRSKLAELLNGKK